MRAWIICNGDIKDYDFYKAYKEQPDIVICADGGAKHLEGLELMPDILLGDMDSIGESLLKKYENYTDKKIEINRYPSNKDKTDTQIAIEKAIMSGCDEIIIIGGLGSRFDHSYTNVTMLSSIMDSGIRGKIINENNEIYVMDGLMNFIAPKGQIISLIPISDIVTGITTLGLEYTLRKASIKYGSSYGVSNVFAIEEVKITIESGVLMVVLSKD